MNLQVAQSNVAQLNSPKNLFSCPPSYNPHTPVAIHNKIRLQHKRRWKILFLRHELTGVHLSQVLPLVCGAELQKGCET